MTRTLKQTLRLHHRFTLVWLDNQAIAVPTLLATAVSTQGVRYTITKPPKKSDIINCTTTKVRYDQYGRTGWHIIYLYDKEGDYQDLI
ncbi:Necrosis inducing protein NPP1 [Phytophthora megakarya]|uniref:Necrosis inducing protein NPP1 n=1 Tax=Phytophthora megakarya TaxID=4795 RepID=A0A225VGX8_9STRA|nr:Necrosis inducing protein NPP1 [Phytophthora megakarya]